MTKTIEIVADYCADPDQVFASALRFSEMGEAMAGLAVYSGFPESDTAKQGDTIVVDVTFWGIFKQRGHTMFIERLDRANRIIQSRESGQGVTRWDHTLSVQPHGTLARWTDRVVIEAGWRTALMARFAAYIYARRHRHRNALAISSRIVEGDRGG
jgi:hypothetical protein